jgi:hypothetical protein
MTGENLYATADELADQPTPDEDDVKLASGKLVRVRALSRAEVLVMQTLKAKGILDTEDKWERHMLARAIVNPSMTVEQIAGWQQERAGGDLEDVTRKISDLSGLTEGADKSGVPDAGPESGS